VVPGPDLPQILEALGRPRRCRLHLRGLVHITDPWINSEASLLVRAGSGIRQPADAVRARIASYALAVHRRFVKQTWPAASIMELPAYRDVLQAVCQGQVDAGFFAEQTALTGLLEQQSCAHAPLRLLSVPSMNDRLGVASTFEAADAADAIRDGIGELAQEGRLAPILNEWAYFAPKNIRHIEDLIHAARRERWLRFAVAALCLVLVALLWWARRLRLARYAADRANAGKSTFIASVSHEVRTPLSGIIGLSRILEETPLTPSQRELSSAILQSSESLLDIVDDILDLSRIEAGKLTIEQVDFSLRAILDDGLRALRIRAAENDLALNLHIPANVPARLRGDPARLRQILPNLVGNAIKFTRRGSIDVRVGLAAAGQNSVSLGFEVADTGIGIEPATLARLFTPFSQADSSTSRRSGGFGFGLAISRQLAEAMGGSISATSTPGQGSQFRFVLPFGLPSLSTPLLPNPDSADFAVPRPLRILVAEDNSVNQRVAEAMLRKLGHAVSVVPTGASALDAWRSSAFDLILMDCQMPEMDGYQATREIRRLESWSRRTPIVAMTAHAMRGDRDRCLEAGMDDYLSKPVRPEDLRSVLARWS
jgi:signal transduction histidine kinase/CheY-like chemotaxis protein